MPMTEPLPTQGSTARYPYATALDGTVRDLDAPVTAAKISDSTATGRSVLTATDAGIARAAIGAGTSNLGLGVTPTTAKAGDYAPPAATLTASGLVELATTTETMTGTDAVRAVTPEGVAAVLAAHRASIVGYQTWNGTAWSARPTGFRFVEQFSDGTAGSVRAVSAPEPTGALNGDRWWKAIA